MTGEKPATVRKPTNTEASRTPSLYALALCVACATLAPLSQSRAGDLTADKATVDDTLYLGGTNSTWDLTNSLMAQFCLDDDTNTTTVVDGSGRSHTGTLYGGENTEDKHVSGAVGTGAITFNGSDDYVRIPNSSDFQFGTNSFSISVWINPDVLAGRIVDKTCWEAYYPQYLMELEGDGRIMWYTHYTDYSIIYSVSSASTGVWTHVVGVRHNDGLLQIYINGALDYEETLPVRYVSNSNDLALGREARNSYAYYTGKLDEVAVFNKALTAAEVRGLYNEGLGTSEMTGVQYGVVQGELVFEGNTNRIKGTLRCDQGITYSLALGDIPMGSFTNAP